ncbi:arylsulfatase B-like [Haliotis rubra]|uniref:arylsulfatase B-like n=1 Tax=Haliotis rubra TaxID=36100 RepID=UPI001EE575DE|nr:arylsulfatase B-like [Haliotis rubra]
MHLAEFLLLCACCTVLSAKSSRPNIIFILADDYGFHDIGYHKSEIKTPNLDKLAAAGVKLENYYVQPICTPTRSQFMSGRYQIHTGLQHAIIWSSQPNGLPLDSPTVADKIKQAGYSTHAVGKWHLGFYKDDYLPTNRGFDSYYGYLTGSEDYFTHIRCDDHDSRYSFCGLDLRNNTNPVFNETGHYSTSLFTERAISVIKDHDESKPFFLYLAYQSTHAPLQVPGKYLNPYSHIKDLNRRSFAGMTACMDEGIGNITSALNATGQLENTLIVFSTDNGGTIYDGGNNWPLRGWKGTLWEGGFHGVGFVYGDMLKNKGTVNNQLIHVSDWFPTLVGVAGGNTNGTKPLDGFDQWKTISEGGASPRKELLHNIDILTQPKGAKLFNNTFDTRIRAAIRVGDWKLITGDPGNGSWIPPPHLSKEAVMDKDDKAKNLWLFDIAKDPNEHNDLSASQSDIVKKLLDRLEYYQKTAIAPRYPDPDPKCDPKLHGGVWGPWE